MTILRPMKAWNKTWDLASLIFPVIASPKLNGERCTFQQGRPLSSSGKPIRNIHIQREFASLPSSCAGLDGELTAGTDPTVPGVRRATRSIVGSHHSLAPWTFWVFDSVVRISTFYHFLHSGLGCHSSPYGLSLRFPLPLNTPPWLFPVPQVEVLDLPSLLALEAHVCSEGWEGLILRSPNQPYKHGRCTWNEFLAGRGMLKLKRFAEAEARIVGYYPLERNTNPIRYSPLGYVDRSTSAAHKVADHALLGGFIVRLCDGTDRIMRVGSAVEGAWDEAERALLITEARRGTLTDRLLTFRYFPEGDPDTLPAQPAFVSWRCENDT